ncbi:Glutamate--tRNA ligase [Roseivivax jejudonensis]|uniref:Glutamate--tRNA ligase n=1 Tax=Roseivivax jejudonensis TaxID=1529041 RepID=A0A1X6Z6Y5_9RHOB|nr:tRNA glutamyl-Q(34) synthetase GluQRS [Roseivivax jejudonensis]SLN42330.1 Glutamate--tRNA ligase [Roseivivax jejudonensis]
MRTRFAPSPTGPLHLGHAYSAILAYDLARAAEGTFVLRIEDIDQGRARAEWETAIHDDLAWLGLSWDRPVWRQSERLPQYRAALRKLWSLGLLYPCTCRRRDILHALDAPQEGTPPVGPDGLIYPGTCRDSASRDGPLPSTTALRLDMRRALDCIETDELFFADHYRGRCVVGPDHMMNAVGDVVLSRREMGTSYHLSVVVDDAAQDITDVVRGEDLLEATPIHVVLQRLLDLPTPRYHHHRLIRDADGKRLAKRDDARAIARYRNDGATPDDIRRMVDLPIANQGPAA